MKKKGLKDELKSVVEKIDQSHKDKQLSSRVFTTLLYRSSEDYNADEVLEKALAFVQKRHGTYAYIWHDRDVITQPEFDDLGHLLYAQGELKKEHCHLVLMFPVQTYMSDLSLAIGLKDQFIEMVKPKNTGNVLLYLTHIKYPDKYQYPVESVFTDVPEYLQYLYDGYRDRKVSIVTSTIAICKTYPKKLTIAEIYVALVDQLGHDQNDFRKYYSTIKDIVREHNIEVDIVDFKDEGYRQGYMDASSEANKEYNLADNFGATKVQRNGKNYILTQDVKANKKGGKK